MKMAEGSLAATKGQSKLGGLSSKKLTSIPLVALPYKLDALAPYISEETLRFHYAKHNKGYVDVLNSLKHGTPYDKLSLEQIIFKSSSGMGTELDKQIFNNASQVWNHAFYWQCLSAKHCLKPSESFVKMISENFQSVNHFTKEFDAAALHLFGSGWVWLVKNDAQALEIICTSNADSPLPKGLVPLLVCDVWEHAYYLDYKNDRKAYLDNFWKLVNWNFVESCMAPTSSRVMST